MSFEHLVVNSQTPTFQHLQQQKRCNGVYNKVQASKRKKKMPLQVSLPLLHSGLQTYPKRMVQMDDTKMPITSMNLAPIWTIWRGDRGEDMRSVRDILHMNLIHDHCIYSHISPWLGIQLDCTQRSSQKWDRWQFDLLPSSPPAEGKPNMKAFSWPDTLTKQTRSRQIEWKKGIKKKIFPVMSPHSHNSKPRLQCQFFRKLKVCRCVLYKALS